MQEPERSSSFSEFIERCLILDLEVGADGRVRDAGALRGTDELRIQKVTSSTKAIQRIDTFASGAEFVVGHNIVAHDRRLIESHLPGAKILRLPVVDTLYLAPLARPQRPYHALVKDYKLIGAERNNPVADCRLARRLLENCWRILKERKRKRPGLVSVYRSCFVDSGAPEGDSSLKLNGTGTLLEMLGGRLLSRDRVIRDFEHFARGRACPRNLRDGLPSLIDEPSDRPAAAYSLAWLTVAGTGSVLPRWVYRKFPAAPRFLDSIRGTDCGDPECPYCSTRHDPRGKLRQYFGFRNFRSAPTASGGGSLQERIVNHGFNRRPVLAILPTGSGKSLCFQLPAIAHNERTGALTVVISPLQALMKDQVENLNRRTGPGSLAATVNGLLTMPERHDMFEGIRLGRYALLYVSPEQFRSRSFKAAIGQRVVATWVFDEAHCLSKWGHDFRPDYLYAARFIREFSDSEGIEPVPVACFTATAKVDVREEIVAHFREGLGQELGVLAADRADRKNLHYSVEEVLTPHKAARIHESLVEHIGDPASESPRGSAIVYAALRKRTEELAAALRRRGWSVEHFHGGLDPPDKKRVQDAFIAGEVPVIVATDAFGMGIDKENVRLVVHADVPGSLESYLQEAGRAGRDEKPAHCMLLFSEGDLETQFDLAARSRLTQRDIAQILRAVRRAQRDEDDEIVFSPGELLRVPDTKVSFNERERAASTKVRTAVAWLERSGFLHRNENRTRVFQGVPAVRDISAAKRKMERLGLPEGVQRQWLDVLAVLESADLREGIDADQLAHLPSFRSIRSRVGDNTTGRDRTATREILRTLDKMVEAGLLEGGIYFSAWVRHKTVNRSLDRLAEIVAIEKRVVELLRADSPNEEIGEAMPLSVAGLQERLRSMKVSISRDSLRILLMGWVRESLAGRALITLRSEGRNKLRLGFETSQRDFQDELDLRARLSQVILQVLLDLADRQGFAGERLVRFSTKDIRRGIDAQLGLASQIGDPFNAIEKTLLFLDEHHVIRLQKGLSVFRQAMTIRLRKEAKGRRYSARHYRPLHEHYEQRVRQIHAIGRYVEEVRDGVDGGRRYVQNYFSMSAPEFERHYFADDPDVLERATSRASYSAIVESLRNDAQEEIVTAPKDRNLLVLAGPGSGKTRVVVHRCAYLLRVERIQPEHVLVICFNRSSMHELRVRLRDLVGDLAREVAVHTYHSLALRLTERSMAARVEAAGNERIDFDSIIEDANRRLRGEESVVGAEPDELRDRLLSGFEYVLVDEYQDIDSAQYEMISHIARRSVQDEDAERRATILAVGDDDQSIYGWRGANVHFLRQFEQTFGAEQHYLVENYRSTRYIINAANALIRNNQDRMKAESPVRVSSDRARDPHGGEWQSLDPVSQGRVSLIEVADSSMEARETLAEIKRLRGLDPSLDWQDFAILAPTHDQLATVRTVLERQDVPVRRALRDKMPPLVRIREFKRLLAYLREDESSEILISELRTQLGDICGSNTFWTKMADRLLASVEAEVGEETCPSAHVLEALYRSLADHHRSHIVGDGVLVGTVHAAKGLEFPHVIVLGGGWMNREANDSPRTRGVLPEEKRRVYYVAMTRSVRTLTLPSRQDDPLPFAREVERWCRVRRRIAAAEPKSNATPDIRYTVLGMKDLYIDLAGEKHAGHPIHRSLARLQAGDLVMMQSRQAGRVSVLNLEGTEIARLSNAAAGRWQRPQLEAVSEVRILGMVVREKHDGAPEYRDRIAASDWELPILEVCHRPRIFN